MIQPRTDYEVICDTCGQRLEVEDIIGWITEEDAKDALESSCWTINHDGTVICDSCRIENEFNDKQPEL